MVISNGMSGMDFEEEYNGDTLKSGYPYGSLDEDQNDIDGIPVSQDDAWAVIS